MRMAMEWRRIMKKSFELISKAAEQGYPYAMSPCSLYGKGCSVK